MPRPDSAAWKPGEAAPEKAPLPNAQVDAAVPEAPPVDPKPVVRAAPIEPREHPVFDRMLGVDVEVIHSELSRSARESATPTAATPPQSPAALVAATVSAVVAVAESAAPVASRGAEPPAGPQSRVDIASLRGKGPTKAAEGTTRPATQERVEFVQRIVRAARVAETQGGARMRLVLNPPQLGHLKVDLSLREHVLHAKLRAEAGPAEELVRSQIGTLREALESQGIRVGSIEVTAAAAGPHGREVGDRHHSSRGDRSRDRREEPDRRVEGPRASRARGRSGTSLVDVLA